MPDRPKLPYVDLINWKGLYTKSSPDVLSAEQLRLAENCDFFQIYGAISKTKGSARVLSSVYQESSVTKKIPWIDFYKASDLDGQILRHVLVAAGSKLGRIDSGSITVLKSDRTEDLFHSADRLDKFMFITNQDPDLVGLGDDLVKYDGAVISKWGITPPGSEETIIDDFNSASSFDRFRATVTDDTTTTFNGDSIRIDKDAAHQAFKNFYVEKSYIAFYVIQDQRDSSKSASNRVNFFTYIPRGQLTEDCIRTSSFDKGDEEALSVWLSPDSDDVVTNNRKFYFPIGSLVEGWNKLNLDFSTEAASALTGSFYPEVDRVQRVRWNFKMQNATDTVSGIRLDKFVVNDQGIPIVTPSGSGNFFSSGAYQYKVTYVSKYGHESNAGPASPSTSVSNNTSIELSNIPVSTDPQITGRRLYRTVAGGSVFLFLDEIQNNTSQKYSDVTSDANLGNSTPPQAGDFSDDNSPPPQAGIVRRWKRTIFMAGDPQNPETLFFSEDDEPESFPLLNAFQLDGKITAIYETYSALIVETETGKWQVVGDNPDFSVDKIIDNMGCVGRRAAGNTRLIGYAVDRDGMRLFDGNSPLKISEPIRDKYDSDIVKSNIELMHTVHSRNRNVILQFNPDATAGIPEYNNIFAYNYSIDDPTAGYWTTIELPSTADLNFIDAAEIEDSNGDFHLYAAGDDGMVYELFEDTARDWVDAVGTKYAVRTRFRTPYLRLGEMGMESEGVTGRVRPRYVEVRLKDNTAANLTVTIESADGSSQEIARDSQDVDMVFGTNNSMIRQAIKTNYHAGEYIRITVDNNEKDVELTITGIRVYFHVLPFEGQILTVDNTATGPS
jgi:hypothetical protein